MTTWFIANNFLCVIVYLLSLIKISRTLFYKIPKGYDIEETSKWANTNHITLKEWFYGLLVIPSFHIINRQVTNLYFHIRTLIINEIYEGFVNVGVLQNKI